MKNTILNPISNLKEKMINSSIGLKIKDYILTTPSVDCLYKTMHLFNLTTASRANEIFAHILPENNKYFKENAGRVQNIVDNLADEKSKQVLAIKGPAVCEVKVQKWQLIVPKVSSDKKEDGSLVARNFEDMYPYLEPSVLEKIIKDVTEEKE